MARKSLFFQEIPTSHDMKSHFLGKGTCERELQKQLYFLFLEIFRISWNGRLVHFRLRAIKKKTFSKMIPLPELAIKKTSQSMIPLHSKDFFFNKKNLFQREERIDRFEFWGPPQRN